MNDTHRRMSQNNMLLREIILRLRDYDLEEVVIICNKYRKRRNLPPLDPDMIAKYLPDDPS
ncbi:MAG: hypothetical protein LBJ46_10970 [Planctomycetota bacterium]|nr:hypothetical protein [Planctomycetota bacterium]